MSVHMLLSPRSFPKDGAQNTEHLKCSSLLLALVSTLRTASRNIYTDLPKNHVESAAHDPMSLSWQPPLP